MTLECFTLNIRRIEKTFGGVIPAERVSLLSKQVEGLTDQEWIWTCEAVIGYERTLPTLKEFLKHAEPFLKNHKQRDLAERVQKEKFRSETGQSCPTCDDIGSISAVRREGPQSQTYAFGCPEPNCEARRLKASKLPKWSDEYLDNFKIYSFEIERGGLPAGSSTVEAFVQTAASKIRRP